MPYWRLFYHAVWGTKNRLALIAPVWEEDLYGYIWGKATALGCIPHATGGMPDHLHVAISIPPKLSVATLVGQLKGASSHHINKAYADGSRMRFMRVASRIRGLELFRKSFSLHRWLHQ